MKNAPKTRVSRAFILTVVDVEEYEGDETWGVWRAINADRSAKPVCKESICLYNSPPTPVLG